MHYFLGPTRENKCSFEKEDQGSKSSIDNQEFESQIFKFSRAPIKLRRPKMRHNKNKIKNQKVDFFHKKNIKKLENINQSTIIAIH